MIKVWGIVRIIPKNLDGSEWIILLLFVESSGTILRKNQMSQNCDYWWEGTCRKDLGFGMQKVGLSKKGNKKPMAMA